MSSFSEKLQKDQREKFFPTFSGLIIIVTVIFITIYLLVLLTLRIFQINTMSDKKGFYDTTSQDTNFRRTWDKSEFEAKAKIRAQTDREIEEDEERKAKGLPAKKRHHHTEKQPEREMLKAREHKVVLDTNLNKTQVVAISSQASKTPGFYCDVCDCTVKDSVNYLDHINGKKHQKNLGMSMKVERSTTDQVKERLAMLKRKKDHDPAKEYDLDKRIENLKAAEEDEKRRRKERKRAKREEQKSTNMGNEEEGDNEEKKEMSVLMGFAGFGTTKA